MNCIKSISTLFFITFILSCNNSSNTLFKQIDSSDSGIKFSNKLTQSTDFNILDYLYFYNGGGVATADFNNDGLLDLYFVSSQEKNALYLNKGSFKFEDITDKAGVGGKANWQTGVTVADVNGDGLVDIYVCAVGKYKSYKGKNELYINKGAGKDGVPVFEEKAREYGLDFEGFSTQATFFDYDKDGDLDCYLLTHATHSVSSYDKVSARGLRDNEAGDHLFQNNSVVGNSQLTTHNSQLFTDVSAKAGIYGAAMGYGLGIVTADINNDGWDDIYVSNDFHEDDYYYVNQKDGTFKEEVKQHFKHLSKYSMGCDVSDVNNDGLLDVFTSDMHPPDEITEKMSMSEDEYDIYQYKLQFGFYNQYSRNALQLNLGREQFADVAMLMGVSSTDWTWSPLLADYDNDGIKDIFISNGIPRRPNDMDYLKYLSGGIDSMVTSIQPVFAQKVSDQKAIDEMPEGKVANFAFKGTHSLKYEDKSKDWGFTKKTVSNGAIYADLDNDGDLDIVTNDLGDEAGIYQNQTNGKGNYLAVKLIGNTANTQGIGAKVVAKIGDSLQVLHQQPTRGFISSVSPWLHFGFNTSKKIDSLIVIWPNGKMEKQANVATNQVITLNQSKAMLDGTNYRIIPKANPLFIENDKFTDIIHKENEFLEFTREPLMPFKASTDGPKIAVGDVNGDGLEDMYLCGARYQAGQLVLQNKTGKFTASNQPAITADAENEDTDALFFDVDNDKDLDLYVVSGGNEYVKGMTQLKDRLYINDGKGKFTKNEQALPFMDDNKSCVTAADFDKDGDLDLFVGGRTIAFRYGQSPNSYLLVNNGKGQFEDKTKTIAPELQKAGLITAALWTDVDDDKDLDLVVVGEWTGVMVFENRETTTSPPAPSRGVKNRQFIIHNSTLTTQKGLWHSIAAADMDNDGDMDLVVGNLGQNTKYIKQKNPVLRMYANDLDQNGRMEQLLTYQRDGKWYPVASRDELAKMAPFIINKRFNKYSKYAGNTMEDLFKQTELSSAIMSEVNTFSSVYIENKGNHTFEVHELPLEAQFAPIFAIDIQDFDNDGKLDILCGGNFYGVSTYQGQYDASYGWFLKGDGRGKFAAQWPKQSGFMADGEMRDLKSIKIQGKKYVVAAMNNKPVKVFGME